MARKTKESTQKNEMTQNKSIQAGEMNSYENDIYQRSRCGGALRLARESQGLSIQDIASRLRLSTRQIEAIEADNFAILPEPTIVRGFIRNYAKLLKINVEPLLDAYNVLVPSSAPHEFTIKPTSTMKMTGYDKPKTANYIWAGLTLLVGLATWLFYQSYVEKPSPTKPTVTESVVEALPEAALPAAERAAVAQPATELQLPPADTSSTTAADIINQAPSTDAVVDNTAIANTPSVPVTNGQPIETSIAPNPNGAVKLELSATQETWVSVVDAAGKEIFNKTIFAGSRESIDITLPVNVVVGNAGATSISMNGKPVDLAPHSRQNVAHIKLE